MPDEKDLPRRPLIIPEVRRRLKSGDRALHAEIENAVQRGAWNAGLKNKADVEDITQNILFDSWNSPLPDTVERPTPDELMAYLFVTGRNTAYTRLRNIGGVRVMKLARSQKSSRLKTPASSRR